MAVRHAKTSTIPDGTDDNLVLPSDWNASHVFSAEAATYVLAGPVSGTATAPTFRALAATDIPALAYEPVDATIVRTGDANWIDLTDGGATNLHSHAGGGASFAYDGVTITPETFSPYSGQRKFTIELTKGGVPVPDGWYNINVGLTGPGGGDVTNRYVYFATMIGGNVTQFSLISPTNTSYPVAGILVYNKVTNGETLDIYAKNFGYSQADNIYVYVTLPNGGAVMDGPYSIPEQGT
jgi:hypothetical protein